MNNMKLEKCITNMPLTGICDIDVDKAVKCFDDQCSISQWHDEYKLVRTAYKGKVRRLKAAISVEDALEVIKRLGLQAIHSPLYNHAQTWILE